jgi:NosR/NirI family nitrous oxide reductase transcriptional regulator
MNRKTLNIILLFILLGIQSIAFAAPRFPMPEFESGHTQPPTHQPPPRTDFMEYLDVIALIISLSVITWLIHKKRSRKGVFWVSIFSVLYFGFIREGCVCSVGSLQNVTLAFFNPSYHIPITVIAFFCYPIDLHFVFWKNILRRSMSVGSHSGYFCFATC